MSDDGEDYGPHLPPARRQLFADEDSDEDDDVDDEFGQFLIGNEDLALILEDEDELDLGFQDGEEGYEDEEETDSGSGWSSSSIEVLSDSGSSIEVLGDYSAYTDSGMFDDEIEYSPYQIFPQQAPPGEDLNIHNLYYPPISPINASCMPWSPQSWSSRDLYSPMSSPTSPWPMAGDGPYSPDFSLDDSCADLPPMWWDVTASTYKTANDTFNTTFMPDSSFYSAHDSSWDDCY